MAVVTNARAGSDQVESTSLDMVNCARMKDGSVFLWPRWSTFVKGFAAGALFIGIAVGMCAAIYSRPFTVDISNVCVWPLFVFGALILGVSLLAYGGRVLFIPSVDVSAT